MHHHHVHMAEPAAAASRGTARAAPAVPGRGSPRARKRSGRSRSNGSRSSRSRAGRLPGPPPARTSPSARSRPRSVSTMPPASASRRHQGVRVVVAGDEQERMAEPDESPAHQRELERRAARGEVAGEEQRPPERTARSSAGSASRLLWRSEARTRHLWIASPRSPLRGFGDESAPARRAASFRSSPRSPAPIPCACSIVPERDWNVRTVGVVLGIRDLAARREEQGQRQAAGERGPERRSPSQRSRGGPAAAHGERDDEAGGGQAAQEDEQEQSSRR